jgi:hypothetical protein
MKLQAEGVLP